MTEIIVAIITSICLTASQPIYIPMCATAYCQTGYTASGEWTRDGICATGNRELMGNIAVLYQRLPDGSKGKYIGTYEILDTGCKENVIDVWCEDLEKCQDFMDLVYEDGCKGKVLVELRKKDEWQTKTR